MSEIDTSAPERIWLQTGGDYAEAHEAAIGTETGVTWCDTPQDERDQGYVRDDLYDAMRERAEKAEAEVERLREALEKIERWSKAYPNDLFPEPDFKRAHALLSAGGMSLDLISASAIRHAAKGAFGIARAALRNEGGDDE